jgi:hypothetical protein
MLPKVNLTEVGKKLENLVNEAVSFLTALVVLLVVASL